MGISRAFRVGVIACALVTGVVVLQGCSRHGASAVQANPDIRQSFQVRKVEQGDLSARSDLYLVIRKAALDKEFLMNGSIIEQKDMPTSHALQSRIVAFKRFQDSVYLLEATQGHVVTPDLPSARILAQLPIRDENEDSITLDFNGGMKQVFVNGDYYAEPTLDNYKSSEETQALPVFASFLSGITTTGNVLEIRQVVQVEEEGGRPSLELRYYLRPYLPSPDFVVRDVTDYKRVGYFATNPMYNPDGKGELHSRIHRWSVDKPITWAISANTPVEFRDAVKAGILYWNLVFGREVVRAEIAPEGVTAPDHRYNVIQWVPNDSAGSAYADSLDDPRTGEVLHSQVYLTSVFATNMLKRSDVLLRKFRRDAADAETPAVVRPRFLQPASLCHLEVDEQFARELISSAGEAARVGDEATAMRLARDYVLITVAHEVGHTLGLRHNFAGSLATSFTNEDRDRIFKEYLLTDRIPSTGIVTSSVMEYSVLMDRLLTAAAIRQNNTAYPYDRVAIEWGYFGRELDRANSPLFCTDHEAGNEPSVAPAYADCRRSDDGAELVVSNLSVIRSTVDGWAYTMVEQFIQAKTSGFASERKSFEEVAVDPASLVTKLTDVLGQQANWVSDSGTPVVAFKTAFPFTNSTNADEIRDTRRRVVETQIAKVGGVDGLLFPLAPVMMPGAASVSSQVLAALEEFLKRPGVVSGKGYDGKPYRLENADIAAIRAAVTKAVASLDEQLLAATLDVFGGKYKVPASLKYPDTELGYAIERRLADLAQAVVLARDSSGEVTNAGVPASRFLYKNSTRAKAIAVLSKGLGAVPDWSYDGRAELKAKLTEIVEKAMGKKLSEMGSVDLRTLPRPLRQWYMEQKALLDTI